MIMEKYDAEVFYGRTTAADFFQRENQMVRLPKGFWARVLEALCEKYDLHSEESDRTWFMVRCYKIRQNWVEEYRQLLWLYFNHVPHPTDKIMLQYPPPPPPPAFYYFHAPPPPPPQQQQRIFRQDANFVQDSKVKVEQDINTCFTMGQTGPVQSTSSSPATPVHYYHHYYYYAVAVTSLLFCVFGIGYKLYFA